jgi:SPP1 family holin
MNKETKIRTVVAAIVSINEALMAFGITHFEGVTENTIYMVVSTIAMFITWGVSHYKNNDFSEEGCEGTGLTRLLKAQKKGVNGENFFDEAKEVGEDA